MKSEALLALAIFAAVATDAIGEAVPATAQTESVLYSFIDYKDAYPEYLLFSNGGLFGTTSGVGGEHNCCGDVYELVQSEGSWTFTELYRFRHNSVGKLPNSGLAQDINGNLYGTTYGGGLNRRGTVFALANSGGAPDFIWNFGRGKDAGGRHPFEGNLIIDGNGSLYGEAEGGTHNAGVVYEVTPSGGSWNETALYDFRGTKDGAAPIGGLYTDAPGSLWGVTEAGGASCDCGTVFHLVLSGGVWTETVIHRFREGGDGGIPRGALVEDTRGNLYGTTATGGAYGHGTVFEISPSKSGGWREMVIFSFCEISGCPDGSDPLAGLAWGPSYNSLYGTTEAGGDNKCGGGAGCGTVFSLTNSNGLWSETVVHSFEGGSDGSVPFGPVSFDASGNLYGTTFMGGSHNIGTVWEITP